ncbi:MAG TPA: hypothetical protein DIT05_17030 [Morganella sp. (in: Bacteria)]|nr:hypothetical protein [Morganella sp. (in: enterobacteria)]
MKRSIKTALIVTIFASLCSVSTAHATKQSRERQQARDVRQDTREKARETKQDCVSKDNKSNQDCRQDKRQTKQDGRQEARRIKY